MSDLELWPLMQAFASVAAEPRLTKPMLGTHNSYLSLAAILTAKTNWLQANLLPLSSAWFRKFLERPERKFKILGGGRTAEVNRLVTRDHVCLRDFRRCCRWNVKWMLQLKLRKLTWVDSKQIDGITTLVIVTGWEFQWPISTHDKLIMLRLHKSW